MPGTSLSAVNPQDNLESRCHYPHFTEKETEAQKCSVWSQGSAAGAPLLFPRVFWQLLLTSPTQPRKGVLTLVAGDSCTEGSTPPR